MCLTVPVTLVARGIRAERMGDHLVFGRGIHASTSRGLAEIELG